MDKGPFLSVVTPVLNRASFVAQAIESVVHQCSGVTYEHIVVDGGSTDGTQDIVRRYPHVKLVERLDGGIYGAFNRGVFLSRGKFVSVLNSDDVFLPGAFVTLERAVLKRADADCYAGGAVFNRWGDGDRIIKTVNDRETKELSLHALAFDALLINARFFRRDWFDEVGFFDESYAVAGDREFLWRCRLQHADVICLPEPVYCYRLHDGSKTLNTSRPDKGWRAEHLRLSRMLLADAFGASERQVIRSWHGIEVTRQVVDDLRAMNFHDVAAGLLIAFRSDALWSIYVLKEVARRLVRKLQRSVGL